MHSGSPRASPATKVAVAVGEDGERLLFNHQDPRLLLGLHNIRGHEVFVGCFACESSWTRAVAAIPCPGEPTSYGPNGEPLWNGKPLKVDGQQRDTHVVVSAVGRNDPCPCGSGEKFKRCHGG